MSSNSKTTIRRGSCLCGLVEFTVNGPVRQVIACHCKQCRKWSGNYWSATACDDKDLTIERGDGEITWYQSSEFAKRGFCRHCGSNLFYKPFGLPKIQHVTSISPGLFDEPTEFEFGRHIFCANRGDYYELPENAEIVAGYKVSD